ncbi:MAG: DUF4426 domain-containing protein [Lysobacteraceae bacterium]|nr:MAG: DUF4426 domain-containing protein [Xanthomonadaceae bacterium]
MHRLLCLATISFALVACGRNETAASPASASSAAPAATQQSATTSTTVGGVTLQTSTLAIADLNEMVARRYGIDRNQDGVLLLVTVRDAAGNGTDPGDLQLAATASALPDAPKPLDLRVIRTDGMTDYIGVLRATPPASVQFKLTAMRGGARSDIAMTAELYPR